MGEGWEILIRSVKTALYTVLKEQAPRQELLITLLSEVEHSVNLRPLTHVSLDIQDKETLTSNHFLIGISSEAINSGNYNESLVCLRKQCKLAQHFVDAFLRRWIREYLPTLTSLQKWNEKGEPIEIGDIVLIVDLQAPRNTWRKGSVICVFPGKDG